ncbi:uncharacterized protein METZ01_LOCUS389413, partial [marine metagenome]
MESDSFGAAPDLGAVAVFSKKLKNLLACECMWVHFTAMLKQVPLKPVPIFFVVLGMCFFVQDQWGVTRKDDLLFWYDFNKIQNNRVPDQSGKEHSASIHGAPELVDGQFGKALHFKSNLNSNDPNGDYLTGESFEIGGAISVAVWVKYLTFANWSRMIDFGNGAGQQNLVFANEGGGRSGAWDVKQTAGGDENFRIGNFWLQNEWMHAVVMVEDNGTNQSRMRFFRNG